MLRLYLSCKSPNYQSRCMYLLCALWPIYVPTKSLLQISKLNICQIYAIYHIVKKPWLIWRLIINSPKFYIPIFLISFCINMQSAKVFFAKPILGYNLPNFFTAKIFLLYSTMLLKYTMHACKVL